MSVISYKIRTRLLLFAIIFFHSIYFYSQTEIITGTITDNKGVPLPGVNILEDTKTSDSGLREALSA